MSRDVWEGDLNRPLSLNAWNYGIGNPLLYIDPSGAVPIEGEIGSHFIYSCDCGWIDLHHANPSLARSMYSQLSKVPTQPKLFGKTVDIGVREDILAYRLAYGWPAPLSSISNERKLVVKTNLPKPEVDEAALAMLIIHENMHEKLTAWAWPLLRSGFSEEDLTSNLIGFYMQKYGYPDARIGNAINEDGSTWRWLKGVCGIPGNTLQDAIDWSESVFKSYGKYNQIEEWGLPRLVCTSEISKKCLGARTWPGELRTVEIREPSPSGNFWLYSPFRINTDGIPIESEIEDIYFLWHP